MGRPIVVPVDDAKASRLSGPRGSPMLVAAYGDLSNIPTGIRSQKDIGRPTTDTVIPAFRRDAAAASPYGPAPRIATSATTRSSTPRPHPASPSNRARSPTPREAGGGGVCPADRRVRERAPPPGPPPPPRHSPPSHWTEDASRR